MSEYQQGFMDGLILSIAAVKHYAKDALVTLSYLQSCKRQLESNRLKFNLHRQLMSFEKFDKQRAEIDKGILNIEITETTVEP